MKKYLLDTYHTINYFMLLIFFFFIDVFFVILSLIDSSIWVVFWIFVPFTLVAILTACFGIYKYYGVFYYDDKTITLKKGKQEVTIKFTDIRWIELYGYTIMSCRGGYSKKRDWKFGIRLYNEKQDLDFFITNNVIIDLIEKHSIRIMPDYLQKAYLSGELDLRIKPKRKKEDSKENSRYYF